MIPRDMLPHQPPDPLHRVGLWAVRRQEVEIDPIPVLPQIDRHRRAAMELGVVADHANVESPVQRQGDQGTGPTAADGAEVAWTQVEDHRGDEAGPDDPEAKGAAAVAAAQSVDPLRVEPLDPTVDGSRAAVQ